MGAVPGASSDLIILCENRISHHWRFIADTDSIPYRPSVFQIVFRCGDHFQAILSSFLHINRIGQTWSLANLIKISDGRINLHGRTSFSIVLQYLKTMFPIGFGVDKVFRFYRNNAVPLDKGARRKFVYNCSISHCYLDRLSCSHYFYCFFKFIRNRRIHTDINAYDLT